MKTVVGGSTFHLHLCIWGWQHLQKPSPKCHFTHIFLLFFLALGHPPTTLLPDGALTYPQLPATVSNVCTTDERQGGVGRVPPPTQQKSWLLRWLSKPIIKLELSESCCSMYTKCIQCQYHTHNLLSIYWIQWTVFVYFWKLLIAISTYMTCDFAHSMVNMWCNSCILVAFYRWHSEWHMYKVSTTWMHFMKLNIVATNFDCDFLETWVLRHLLSSTEPHFLVSRQNCLNFLTQYLDNILDTMDRAVFWTYCLFSRNEPCMYTDCSVLGKPFFNN